MRDPNTYEHEDDGIDHDSEDAVAEQGHRPDPRIWNRIIYNFSTDIPYLFGELSDALDRINPLESKTSGLSEDGTEAEFEDVQTTTASVEESVDVGEDVDARNINASETVEAGNDVEAGDSVGIGNNVRMSESADGRMDVETGSESPSEFASGIDLLGTELENADDVQTRNLDVTNGSQHGVNTALVSLEDSQSIPDDEETIVEWDSVDDRGIGVELENDGGIVTIPKGSYIIHFRVFWSSSDSRGESRTQISPDMAAAGWDYDYGLIYGQNDEDGDFSWSTHSHTYVYGSSNTREFEFQVRQRTGSALDLSSDNRFETKIHIAKIG
jgi:hypothetical protein